MTTKLTDEELAQIEQRASVATKGPFHWVQIGRGACDALVITMDGREARREDQYLFAHAQADLAALSAEVRRLQEELAVEKAETERTRIQRGTARQQAAEFQQMFHLAIKERDQARQKAREFWGTIKLYIRSQGCFTGAQNEERIARALKGHEWLEPSAARSAAAAKEQERCEE